MRGPVYKELRALKRSGGDLYQKFADKHDITRKEAKEFLYPFLYGAQLSKTFPVLTEADAIELLDQFNKLYSKTIDKIEVQSPSEKTNILYARVNGRLVKVPPQEDR